MMRGSIRFTCPAILLAMTLAARAEATLRITISDAQTGAALPCRVHLVGADGKPVKPPKLPFWRDHFVCDGAAEVSVGAGELHYEIERGPEWNRVSGKVAVKDGETVPIVEKLARFANLGAEGWWSGETHVHRPLAELPLLMRAEDLHVASAISWWNDRDESQQAPRPAEPVIRHDGNRFFHTLGGEDERGGGALLFHRMKEPLPLARYAGKTREWPSSAKWLDDARRTGAWVEAEKPFWWDLPLWLARGVDSVGIAHNHLHRSGVFDGEAWGRPRDATRYPGPHGNGRYTQDIWWHALDCGLRLTPSAGSASGVLPNPVGYNRAYVHCEGELTWEKWWDGFRAGRVFVTNGPLLRVTANGQLPGAVLKTDGGPLEVHLAGRLDSRDPIVAVELVHNRRVDRIQPPARITIHESGWFLVRAIANVQETYRFASTAPWYVEIGGKAAQPHRDSAQFFLDWTRERIAQVEKIADESQRADALAPWRETKEFWDAKIAATVPRLKVTGKILDAATDQLVPARVYLEREDGRSFFPESDGAVRYERRSGINPRSVEFHTTLPAQPWRVELEPGRYTLTVERGPEWFPAKREFTVTDEPLTLEVPLRRRVDMAALGWFSGDTHVHRPLAELPLLVQAEDLNVAFPLTHWVTRGFTPPTQGDKNTDAGARGELMRVDATHVIWPLNTEWEIFSLNGKPHTLGAVFALGHKTPFSAGVPPLAPILEQARREGALLDLDKHDWPWGLTLPPLLGPMLYELSNNHVWRTEFGYTKWVSEAPPLVQPSRNGAKDGEPRRSGTERDWLEYTHRTYWALLDCGLRLLPSAGTASGVHPVPLGFSRVYAKCDGGFDYDRWLAALRDGRSFVTTGPMLLVECEGEAPGGRFTLNSERRISVRGRVLGEQPVNSIEVIVNGEIAATLNPGSLPVKDGGFETQFHHPLTVAGTTWIALRCWEPREGGRERFAHSAPWWFDDGSRPLHPRREEVEYLAGRVRAELARSRALLPADAIAEYERALRFYESLETR